ncbi:unnamed protein product [Arabidopsis halleri]
MRKMQKCKHRSKVKHKFSRLKLNKLHVMRWCATRVHVHPREFTVLCWYCFGNSEDKRFMHPGGANSSTLVSLLRSTILVSLWLHLSSIARGRMAVEEEERRCLRTYFN